MLSDQDNELLTRVGPGTAMGELMRRFWLPALLPVQLPAPDCPPIRLRLLGEDLVAFRDSTGKVGILAAHCPHRQAPLYFGRNEECGLRCVYHGWKFDVAGTCVDMPSEPPDSDFKDKVTITAYPARDWGGVLWTYMGPSHRVPELPALEWTNVAPSQRVVMSWLAECNWLQGLEGDLDTVHSMFLHSATDPTLRQSSRRFDVMRGTPPRLSVESTDYGLAYGGRYETIGDAYNWRVTQWLMPSHTIIPNKGWPVTGRAWVPVDDHHTVVFSYRYRPDGPIVDQDDPSVVSLGYGNAWERDYAYGTARFADGGAMETWLPRRNRANDYLLDRAMQRTRSHTGIVGVPTQDRAMTEGMESIVDRTREHLGTSDAAIIALRTRLLRLLRDLQRGIEPLPSARGALYRVRSMDALSAEPDFHRFLREHDRAASA